MEAGASKMPTSRGGVLDTACRRGVLGREWLRGWEKERAAFAGRRAVYAARMPTPKQAAKVGLSWAIDAAFSVARKVVGPPSKRGP